MKGTYKVIKEGTPEHSKAMKYMRLAAAQGRNTRCYKALKTKKLRGCVIVDNKGRVIGRGHVIPTSKKICSAKCPRMKKHDHDYAACAGLHAEEAAIFDALKRNKGRLANSVMYHLKTRNGEWLDSGGPGCTICSRKLAYFGISIVFWSKDGMIKYGAKEQNEEAFKISQQGIAKVKF